MELNSLANFVKQALTLILLLSMPVVVVIGAVGLLVAFLQAITQVQDQTISFGIKLIAAVLVIAVISGWMGNEVFSFSEALFAAIANVR